MRSLITKALIVSLLALMFSALGAVVGAKAVGLSRSPSDNRKDAVESRNEAFNRAKSLYPDPRTSNYPLRKALVEFTQRQDKIHHPWYIYILGDNGNTIGYYVGKTVPENACNFLSSTEDVYKSGDGNLKMQSPSYDGVYYGNAACDAWFFFDAATNALIQIRGVNFYTSDQPLRLDAKAIKVRTG
jgi:hypothetical protein